MIVFVTKEYTRPQPAFTPGPGEVLVFKNIPNVEGLVSEYSPPLTYRPNTSRHHHPAKSPKNNRMRLCVMFMQYVYVYAYVYIFIYMCI